MRLSLRAEILNAAHETAGNIASDMSAEIAAGESGTYDLSHALRHLSIGEILGLETPELSPESAHYARGVLVHMLETLKVDYI